MFERFTPDARAMVVGAQEYARERYDDRILPEHLLLGALVVDRGLFLGMKVDPDEVVAAIGARRGPAGLAPEDVEALQLIGIDAEEVTERLDATGSTPRKRFYGHIPFTKDSKKALELSLRQAVSLGDKHIGVEHIVLGLTMVGGASDVLTQFGIDTASLRAHLGESQRRTG